MKLKLALAALAVAAVSFVSVQAFADEKPAQDKAPAKEAPKVDEEAAAAARMQRPTYPLTKCPISDEDLGSMGKPVETLVDGKLVKVCCKSCIKGVEKDKAAIIKKIDDAVVAAQKASYPLDTCAISGEKLGDKAKDTVVGTRLVRVCCGKCAEKVQKDPAETMAKVNSAYIDAQKKTYKAKCPVSGEEIGADAKDILYGTTLVRLCCKNCEKGFWKDPEAMVKKVQADNAAAKAK